MKDLQLNKGDPLKATDWNSLAGAVAVPEITVGPGLEVTTYGASAHIILQEQPKRRWIGKVVTAGPSSEADYTTNQYWLQLEQIVNYGDPTDLTQCRALVTWQDLSTSVWGYTIITATNMSEAALASHYLIAGTLCYVDEIWDDGSPSTKRFIIECPPLQVLTAKVATLWSPGDTTLSCKPCDPSGTVTPSGASAFPITIEFGAQAPAFCAYAVNDVVGYVVLQDGSTYLVQNKMPKFTAQYQAYYNNSATSTINVVTDFIRAV